MKKDIIKAACLFLAALGLAVLFCLVFTVPFQWAWNNAVVNAISIAEPIDFWTASTLLMFVWFLVGFGGNLSTKGRD